MKTIGSFFLGEKTFEVRNMEFSAPGEGEVLIKVMAAGICGTDVHIYHGEKGSADVTPPIVLGHEFSGVVEAIGPGVTTVKPGDAVTLDPNIYCGKCRPCRMGKKQNCEHLFALGVNRDGGFARYCMAPQKQCFPLGDGVSFEEGAMAEPLACALHGIDRARIQPGQSVLVIGGGTIGLLMIQLCRLSGASVVLLSEPVAARREIGKRVGADGCIDPMTEDLPQRIRQITGRDGVDVVIECVGRPAAVTQAFSAAGLGATVVLFSVPGVEDTVPLPLFDVYKKELKIMGSFINPDTHQRAVNLLRGGRLKIRELITHRYGIHHVEDAVLMQMSPQSIKVMVLPQEE